MNSGILNYIMPSIRKICIWQKSTEIEKWLYIEVEKLQVVFIRQITTKEGKTLKLGWYLLDVLPYEILLQLWVSVFPFAKWGYVYFIKFSMLNDIMHVQCLMFNVSKNENYYHIIHGSSSSKQYVKEVEQQHSWIIKEASPLLWILWLDAVLSTVISKVLAVTQDGKRHRIHNLVQPWEVVGSYYYIPFCVRLREARKLR